MMTADHRLFCRGAPKTPGRRPDFVHERIAFLRRRTGWHPAPLTDAGAGPTTPTPGHPLTSLGPSAFSLPPPSPCDLPSMSRHPGACGSRFVRSANGPSNAFSSGGFHGRRTPPPERRNAINAARAHRAIQHSAPAAITFARTPFCTLLAILARDLTSTKTGRRQWQVKMNDTAAGKQK